MASTQITQEQIDRCARIVHENSGEVFYQVLSESDDTTLYTVRFIRGKGFTCTCPSGKEGFRSCKFNSTCKHCRWSAAHAIQFKATRKRAALMELGLTAEEALTAASAQLTICGKPADLETLARVYGPRNPRPTEKEMKAMYDNRPFQLMR